MNTMELGQTMVEMVNQGVEGEAAFVSQYYADDTISVEGQGSGEMPAQIQGVEAIRGKHEWWYANNEVHSTSAEGPYVGNRDDQFVLRFLMDITPTGGERMQMDEVALFTVQDGKICKEEYLYRMG